MKIRVFTLNKDGKIELTKKELQDLLDEAYRDGSNSVTITTPSWQPYYYNTRTSDTITLTNSESAIDGLTAKCTNECTNGTLKI